MLNVDKVYLLHYSKLIDRKNRLNDILPFEVQWVEDEPSEDEFLQLYNNNVNDWNTRCIPPHPYRELKRSDISLLYKHYKTYQDIVTNKYEKVLILEDDIVFDDNFHMFNMFIDSTPKDWDLIFIGQGCNLRVPQNFLIPGQYSYKVNHPASKCTDAYCITYEAAKKILQTMAPFTFPIDFELNYQMKLYNMNVYWMEPPLMKLAGSECGMFHTTKNMST